MDENVNALNSDDLQKLVDGELGHQRRSQLLCSLDDDSSAWRQIAVSFLEKQLLNEALADISNTTHSQPIEAEYKEHANSTRPATGNSSFRLPFLPYLLALAATFVCGIWLGSSRYSETGLELADKTPTLSKSAETKTLEQQPLPLVDALARSVRPVSLETKREFLRAGYILSENHELAEVTLPTGDQIKMPVRQYEIKYLGQAAFQ